MILFSLCFDTEGEARTAAGRFRVYNLFKSAYSRRPWFVAVILK